MAEPDTHYAESADMREVYRRLAERHANELGKSDGLRDGGDPSCDLNSLRHSGAGVEGR